MLEPCRFALQSRPVKADSLEDKMKRSIIAITVVMMVLSISLFGDESFDDSMNKITVEYIKIKDTLVNDKTENVNDIAKAILYLTKKLDASTVMGEHKDHFRGIPTNISAAATDLSNAKNIKSMRKAFNDLSKPMAMWATMMKPVGINVAYCSMNPGSWLQMGTDIRNPYYGASMLKCGEIVSMGTEIAENHVCTEKCEIAKNHVCTDECKLDEINNTCELAVLKNHCSNEIKEEDCKPAGCGQKAVQKGCHKL